MSQKKRVLPAVYMYVHCASREHRRRPKALPYATCTRVVCRSSMKLEPPPNPARVSYGRELGILARGACCDRRVGPPRQKEPGSIKRHKQRGWGWRGQVKLPVSLININGNIKVNINDNIKRQHQHYRIMHGGGSPAGGVCQDSKRRLHSTQKNSAKDEDRFIPQSPLPNQSGQNQNKVPTNTSFNPLESRTGSFLATKHLGLVWNCSDVFHVCVCSGQFLHFTPEPKTQKVCLMCALFDVRDSKNYARPAPNKLQKRTCNRGRQK